MTPTADWTQVRRLFVPAWLVIAVEQGKAGIDVVPHGDERRWDWGVTAGTLARAQGGWRL